MPIRHGPDVFQIEESEQGAGQKATFTGTATVKPDCTGKITIKFYDLSGTLLNTVVKSVVYVNNETEAHAIVTSVVLPNGASVLTVLTTEANKLFFEDEH